MHTQPAGLDDLFLRERRHASHSGGSRLPAETNEGRHEIEKDEVDVGHACFGGAPRKRCERLDWSRERIAQHLTREEKRARQATLDFERLVVAEAAELPGKVRVDHREAPSARKPTDAPTDRCARE